MVITKLNFEFKCFCTKSLIAKKYSEAVTDTIAHMLADLLYEAASGSADV